MAVMETGRSTGDAFATDQSDLAAALAGIAARLDDIRSRALMVPETAAQKAALLYRQRRLRKMFFPQADLFAEPGWDILLDLFSRDTTTVKGACIGASAPPTTALRYITALEGAGLVESRADAKDARVRLLSLTHAGVASMSAYLLQV